MAKKGQKKYWKAHKNKDTGLLFRKAAYGYEIDINHIRFYSPVKFTEREAESGRFDWVYITEEITGACCTVREALQNKGTIAEYIKSFQPVATRPTLREIL